MATDWTAVAIASAGTATTVGVLVATLRHQRSMVRDERRYGPTSTSYVDLLAVFYEIQAQIGMLVEHSVGKPGHSKAAARLEALFLSESVHHRARVNAYGSEAVNDRMADVWEAVTDWIGAGLPEDMQTGLVSRAVSAGADPTELEERISDRLTRLMVQIRSELRGTT